MNLFKNWNQKDINAFNDRTIENSRPAPGAVVECAVRHELGGAASGKAGDAGRVLVRVTSYRRALIDPDNFCPKYFVDCCRYAGFLREDTLDAIKLEEEQVRVESESEECTVMELFL